MEEEKEGSYLKNLKKGLKVEIITKAKKKFIGIIEDIAPRKEYDEKGIMVMLRGGGVGRVIKILSDKPTSPTEELIKKGESYKLEFKTDALWSVNKKEEEIKQSKSYDLHTFRHKASKVIIAKSIAAFLNSEGGNLLIGIKEKREGNEENEIFGIEEDLEKLKTQGKTANQDGYKRMIIDDIIRAYFPQKIYNHLNEYIKIIFEDINGKTICNIGIKKSEVKVFLNLEGRKIFMIRTETESRQIQDEELVDYCMKRFSI
jgi:predicted HTH transcriptional regulator/uncharacterized protein YwbE